MIRRDDGFSTRLFVCLPVRKEGGDGRRHSCKATYGDDRFAVNYGDGASQVELNDILVAQERGCLTNF